jgi:preprotein translocase subunit SecY
MLKALKFKELRHKLILTAIIIVVTRLLAHIPVPGVDTTALKSFLHNNVFFGLFDIFSGGGFQNFSIITLGLAPYINVSIVMQLLTVMVPKLEEMQKEGEYGREKINMYSRLLTVPMALVESYGLYFYLSKQGIIHSLDGFGVAILLFSMMAGSMLMVWLGELITEYGIGNGISALISISIISRLPSAGLAFVNTLTTENMLSTLFFGALALGVIAAVVLVNEGTRNIAIEYGRRGQKSQKIVNYLPIKINQVSVVPILFAVSMVMIPSLVSAPLQASSSEVARNIGHFFTNYFSAKTYAYNIVYFLLVVGFTYFYTSVQFNPEKIADDVKKRGGFIPGIRPGKSTSQYLKYIVDRITLAGAAFLGLIAILPFIVEKYVGVANLSIGGTGLLIVISVVLETKRQIDALTVTKSYDNFLR